MALFKQTQPLVLSSLPDAQPAMATRHTLDFSGSDAASVPSSSALAAPHQRDLEEADAAESCGPGADPWA